MPVQRLSKYDAIFYYTDNRRAPMQINAGLSIAGPINFSRYIEWLTPRIAAMPRLQMALKAAPFGLRLPKWVPADDFDLADHVRAHTLPAPGDDQQLRTLFLDFIHQRLPRTRPLWRVHVVNGREHGHSALFLQVHHCVADAGGMFEFLNVIMDAAPTGDRKKAPTSRGGLARATHADRPLHGARAMLSRDGRRRLAVLVRYARTRGPKFPFVRPVSGKLDVAWRLMPLADVRAIGDAFGATATDVVLAVLGAAFDAYAQRNGVAVAGKSLILQVPANVRLPNQYGELGNEMTMLPGVMPLGIADPVERLRRVVAYNQTLKELDMAPMVHGMMGMAFGLATPPGQALLCKTMASAPYLNLARAIGLPPQDHGLMSSIVLPPLKYTVDGHPVEAFFNVITCQFNMGFALSPVTYDGRIAWTLSVDAENLGDADAIMDGVLDGLTELRGRVVRAGIS